MNTDYAHLRALALAATPGPWEAETRRYSSDAGDYHASHIPGVVDEPASGYDIEPTGAMEAEDAEYIAAINPSTLIALLDEIERLRGDNEWEYYATARKGHMAGETRAHERGAIQAYEEALDQVVFEQEDETPVVFKRRVGPWEPVTGDDDA